MVLKVGIDFVRHQLLEENPNVRRSITLNQGFQVGLQLRMVRRQVLQGDNLERHRWRHFQVNYGGCSGVLCDMRRGIGDADSFSIGKKDALSVIPSILVREAF